MRQRNWSYGPKQNIALKAALDDWILIYNLVTKIWYEGIISICILTRAPAPK